MNEWKIYSLIFISGVFVTLPTIAGMALMSLKASQSVGYVVLCFSDMNVFLCQFTLYAFIALQETYFEDNREKCTVYETDFTD